jgi:hypothetical protein
MAIDNPIDAVEAQYTESAANPLGLVLLPFKIAFPYASPALDFAQLIAEHFSSKGRRERAQAFLDLLRDQQKLLDVLSEKHDRLKVKVEDLAEAVQVAVVLDAEAFNDSKRERYLMILGNAARSDEQIDDVASFIRDVEMLGQRDIAVLRVLNRVMNKDGDWGKEILKGRLHPNTFIQRRRELVLEIAKVFGMDAEKLPSVYSHEEGYSICARLQGFGLAHEIELSAREVPIGEYCFRPSKRGLLLLKLIGDQVPNWNRYALPER